MTKRGFFEARLLVKAISMILSTRLGTLLICGSACLDKNWPFFIKFSEISLDKRERVVKNWFKHWLFTPIRLAFVFLKFVVMLVFFTQVINACYLLRELN